MFDIDNTTRQALLILCLGLIFLIVGGYFGVIQKRIGLGRAVPVTGDLAQIWGAIMCGIGLMLMFIALN